MKKLCELELPWKLLISLFLVVLSCGFGVSHIYLRETTAMADGDPNLSMADVIAHYHGDKKQNTFRRNVTGGMKKYFSELEDPNQLTPEEQKDYERVLAWNDTGAKEAGYWNPDPAKRDEDKNPEYIQRILSSRGCLDCHAPDATMKGAKKDSPLDTWAGISKFLAPDQGISRSRLLMISHVHLLGMGMMFLLLGAFVASTSWNSKIRCLLIVAGLCSILFDIGGWWATKYGGPSFAPLVMMGGGMMAASFGGSVAACLFDLWLRKKPE